MERDAELSTLVGRRPRLFARAVDGHEVDDRGEVGGAEQQHRIDVLVARGERLHGQVVTDSQPEVHDCPVVIGSAAARGPDDVTASDGGTFTNRDGLEERIRGTQPAVVGDGDVERSGNRAREDDGAVVRRPHRRARRGREVDAAVAGSVDGRRRDERPHDGTVDGAEPTARGQRRARDRSGRQRGREDDQRHAGREVVWTSTWRSHRQPRGRKRSRHGEARGRRGDRTGAPHHCQGPVREPKRGSLHARPRYCRTEPGSRSESDRRPRSWRIALVWIWHTRLSVTLRMPPISASVSPS